MDNEQLARKMIRPDSAWRVPARGFEWEQGDKDLYLVPVDPDLRRLDCLLDDSVVRKPAEEREAAWRPIYPLRDHPTLCATFASLRPGSEADLLSFANSYGELGIGTLTEGESLEAWNEAIGEVAAALALLRESRGRSTLKLQEWIEHRDGLFWLDFRHHTGARYKLVADSLDPAGGPVGGLRVEQPVSEEGLSARDLRSVAKAFAYLIIDFGLFMHTAIHLERRKGTVELQPCASGLLGVVWIQVARIAEGAIEHVVCANRGCGAVMAIGARSGGHRISRTTCSERCKKARQRALAAKPARKRTAKRAH